jgi:hypothetical protein
MFELKKDAMTVIEPTGKVAYVKPVGKMFTLKELQGALMETGQQNYIEFAPNNIDGYVVIVDEEGLNKELPINSHYFAKYKQFLAGNVLIVPNHLVD